MQGGQNWILAKEINADRVFICYKSGKTRYVPLWERGYGLGKISAIVTLHSIGAKAMRHIKKEKDISLKLK
jgi:hypothetical protein